MSDSNQIIERLHKQADDQLQRDLNELYGHIRAFVTSRGVYFGESVKIGETLYAIGGSADWLCFNVIKAACADKVRKKAVDDFMGRVAKLSDELDEIRAIAEQGGQQ